MRIRAARRARPAAIYVVYFRANACHALVTLTVAGCSPISLRHETCFLTLQSFGQAACGRARQAETARFFRRSAQGYAGKKLVGRTSTSCEGAHDNS